VRPAPDLAGAGQAATIRRARQRFIRAAGPSIAIQQRRGCTLPTVHPSTSPCHHPEPTMHTTESTVRQAAYTTPKTSRYASLAMAAVLTLAMLTGVNLLATSDTEAPQMAQAASAQA
jgi:hypothetical protein